MPEFDFQGVFPHVLNDGEISEHRQCPEAVPQGSAPRQCSEAVPRGSAPIEIEAKSPLPRLKLVGPMAKFQSTELNKKKSYSLTQV